MIPTMTAIGASEIFSTQNIVTACLLLGFWAVLFAGLSYYLFFHNKPSKNDEGKK